MKYNITYWDDAKTKIQLKVAELNSCNYEDIVKGMSTYVEYYENGNICREEAYLGDKSQGLYLTSRIWLEETGETIYEEYWINGTYFKTKQQFNEVLFSFAIKNEIDKLIG